MLGHLILIVASLYLLDSLQSFEHHQIIPLNDGDILGGLNLFDCGAVRTLQTLLADRKNQVSAASVAGKDSPFATIDRLTRFCATGPCGVRRKRRLQFGWNRFDHAFSLFGADSIPVQTRQPKCRTCHHSRASEKRQTVCQGRAAVANSRTMFLDSWFFFGENTSVLTVRKMILQIDRQGPEWQKDEKCYFLSGSPSASAQWGSLNIFV